jgi:hypothetical protein
VYEAYGGLKLRARSLSSPPPLSCLSLSPFTYAAEATSLWGLKLLVYEALRQKVCAALKQLVYEALSY